MGEIYNSQVMGQSVIYRILDANLDRAREGLRIIEEWCRFGLNHAALTEECKRLRQELAQWHTDKIRSARNTPGDPGTDLTHEREEHRRSISQLLQVNLCRIEEALRVLEEYGKLEDVEMGRVCKQMRYRVYTLESQLMAYRRHQQLLEARLYLVTSPMEELLEVVEAALQGGLKLVQYRDKSAEDGERLVRALGLRQLCDRYGALFLVNDRVDLALAVEADGVHLGQQDLPIAVARDMLGSQKIIGRSTTNPEELKRAIAEGADYVGVGPVFATPTKPNKAAAGYDYIRYAAQHCPIPWFAIGGIDVNNFNEVLEGGAGRIAVVRAIMEAEQPTLVTQYFLSQLTRMETMKAIQQAQLTR